MANRLHPNTVAVVTDKFIEELKIKKLVSLFDKYEEAKLHSMETILGMYNISIPEDRVMMQEHIEQVINGLESMCDMELFFNEHI